VDTRKSIGLIALIAALMAIAVAASGASATIIVPPSKAIELKSTETFFLPENAYSELFVKCTSSVAKFTTPAGRAKGGTTRVGIDQNVNRTSIGTQSTGSGGVWADLTEAPTFTGCNLFKGATLVEKATVNTNSTNGAWSFTGNGVSEAVGSGAVGVPKAGATITVGGATLTISPEESSAVFAPEYNNSTHTLRVDSQLRFNPGASGLVSPAQFEANYTDNKSELTILP
jgi:hypothetical protein